MVGAPPLAEVCRAGGSRDDLGFRVSTVRTGTKLSLVCIGAFVPYLLVTWERPHRTLSLILLLACTPATLAVAALPLRQIVASRWREPFFLAWSAMLVVNCVVSAILDGGVGSPIVWVLVLPLSFAALSYPLGSTIAVGGTVIVGYGAVALTGPDTPIADTLLVSLILALVTWMSAWQAHNHQARARGAGRGLAHRRADRLPEPPRVRGAPGRRAVAGPPRRRARSRGHARVLDGQSAPPCYAVALWRRYHSVSFATTPPDCCGESRPARPCASRRAGGL